MNGTFVVIEGWDGVGKSSAIKGLQKIRNDAIYVKDPGGTEIGQQIREILLNPNNKTMCNTTEKMLYQASRIQLTEEIIKPALDGGKLVISDRWDLSTYIYQGYNDEFNLVPDLMIVLVSPLDVVMKRMDGTDRMESKGREFFKTIICKYIDIMCDIYNTRRHEISYIRTDENSVDEVAHAIDKLIYKYMSKKHAFQCLLNNKLSFIEEY